VKGPPTAGRPPPSANSARADGRKPEGLNLTEVVKQNGGIWRDRAEATLPLWDYSWGKRTSLRPQRGYQLQTFGTLAASLMSCTLEPLNPPC
jgi:hypothetical protein